MPGTPPMNCLRRLSVLALTLGLAVLGCGSAPLAGPLPPVTSATPAASPPVATEDRGVGPPQAGYNGHGAETVPAALLERYRPRPAPADVVRRVEGLIDVRSPGIGAVSPDGKSLYFSWTITGVAQVWKIDGPQRFPQELT